jgi:hypothetical protein
MTTLSFLTAQPGLTSWQLMWTIAFSIFVACKILTGQSMSPAVPRRDRAVYLLGWPGMNPDSFLRKRPVEEWNMRLLTHALRNLVVGWIFLGILGPAALPLHPLLATWLGMIGFIFMLHFGLFHLLAVLWQRMGFHANPIMMKPISARSTSEFWSKRWNQAFHQLTWTYLFRPLQKRLTAPAALTISFLVSGLIHEVVITVPARGGYGGPTVYFLLQALAVLMERRVNLKRYPRLRRVWTLSVVILPAGLLFPPHFILTLMLPMFQAWGLFPTT